MHHDKASRRVTCVDARVHLRKDDERGGIICIDRQAFAGEQAGEAGANIEPVRATIARGSPLAVRSGFLNFAGSSGTKDRGAGVGWLSVRLFLRSSYYQAERLR